MKKLRPANTTLNMYSNSPTYITLNLYTFLPAGANLKNHGSVILYPVRNKQRTRLGQQEHVDGITP